MTEDEKALLLTVSRVLLAHLQSSLPRFPPNLSSTDIEAMKEALSRFNPDDTTRRDL